MFYRIALVLFIILVSSFVIGQCTNTSYGSGATCVEGAGSGGSYTNQSSNSVSFTPMATHAIVIAAYQCWTSDCLSTGTTTLSLGATVNGVIDDPEPCFIKSPRSPFTLLETGAQHLQQYMWFCPSIPSGISTFTVYCMAADGVTHVSSCNYITLTVTEWTGLTTDTTSPFDTDGGAASTMQQTTATVSTATTTNYTDDLIYTFFDNTQDDYACAVSPSVTVLQFFRGNINTGYIASSGGSVQKVQVTWDNSCPGADNTQDDWYGTVAAIKTSASVPLVLPPTNLKAVVH